MGMYLLKENLAIRIPTLSYTCAEIPCIVIRDENPIKVRFIVFFPVLTKKSGIFPRLSEVDIFVITDNMHDAIIIGIINEFIKNDIKLKKSVIQP